MSQTHKMNIMKHQISTELKISLKFLLDLFVRLHVFSSQHGKMKLCWLNNHILIINLHTTMLFD